MQLRSIKDLQNADKGKIQKALAQVQVIPKIEAFLEDLNLETNKRALGVFSASDIGSRGGSSLCGQYIMGCSRMMYHRYISDEPRGNIPPRTRRIFDTGSKVHEQLQGYLHKIAAATNGAEVFVDEANMNASNSKMADELEIESTTDGIWEIKMPALKLRFGLEIKSMKAELFKGLNKAHNETVVQSHVYMGCLDLPAMTILYYNKNDSTMAEFCIPFDQKIWDAIVKKIKFIRKHAIDEEPPPREIGYHCKQCRYHYLCKPPKPEKHSLRVARNKFRL